MISKKLLKNNIVFIFIIGVCFSTNLVCEYSDFNTIIEDIQKYGSKFKIIVGQDTLIATQILDKTNEILTINLLEEKWSNFSLRQNFTEEYTKGSSVPYEIEIDLINCIEEFDRPNILKEYTYIGISAFIFWGILTIFDLL